MFDIPLHKLIIHFPIALTIIGLIYDAWAVYSGNSEHHKASYGLCLWAAITSLIAVVTGLVLAGMTRTDAAGVTGHSFLGIGGAIVTSVIGLSRYSSNVRKQQGYQTRWLLMQIAAAILMFAAAITGHRLEVH